MGIEPDKYRQIRRYPGHWHILLHIVKALNGRYWGAGVEFVAQALGTDDKKSGDASNYRRAHQTLSVTYEALWTMCLEMYLEEITSGDIRAEDQRNADGVVEWIKARNVHRTFDLWAQFLLHDYPAYMTFRVALRTGNFLLRLDALRRIAEIFFITEKDRFQMLLLDHFTEMARMSPSDTKVMAELFFVALGKDAQARIGLDERQEVANRLNKTCTKRILSSSLGKMAPLAR
ncbi:unnamed protein product, partial [Pylaiella littoralis]